MPFQLAIDRGNSRTKASVADNTGKITEHFTISDNVLDRELSLISDKYLITRCILSDVRGGNFNMPVQWNCINMSNGLTFPFTSEYKTPETVGHDRLANMAGASILFPDEDILVIDCGSCVTYSLLVQNTFLGGSIAPGIYMRFKALHQFTGNLPELKKLEDKPTLLGRTTTDSIRSGVEFAIIAETTSMIEEYQLEYGPLKVIITGGDYSFFEKNVKSATFASAYLTQIGLHEILRINNV
jgi:type III pantothenate kinase